MRVLLLSTALALAAAAAGARAPLPPDLSLTLIPPVTATKHVTVSMRAGIRNTTRADEPFDVAFYLDRVAPEKLLRRARVVASARSGACATFDWKPSAPVGPHRIVVTAESSVRSLRAAQDIRIVASAIRSHRAIDGAWVSFNLPNPVEGKYFDAELAKFTDDQWRGMVRDMHRIGMDIVVIEEVFDNNMALGAHHIETDGYKGKAYYPSHLHPGRAALAAKDPIEAMLEGADALQMHVMLGIGSYAWFDYSSGALKWSKAVASELWALYGHHPSFYGWYVTGEATGDLGNDAQRQSDIAAFFRGLRAHCRGLAPDKPVMLAPNCFYVSGAQAAWAGLLPNVDILCPFGFHRMSGNDIGGEAAAALLQSMCDKAGTHLWLDLETFLFEADGALVPRPASGLVSDLLRFPTFETVLCFQYPGMMSAPGAAVHPGGAQAVQLFRDYQEYLRVGPPPRTVDHLARGKPVSLAKPFDRRYTGGGPGALTDGVRAIGGYQDPAWQGFWGADLDATIDLGEARPIARIEASFLQEAQAGIMLPTGIDFALSGDGRTFRRVGSAAHDVRQQELGPLTRTLSVTGLHDAARYVRVTARSAGKLPDWHAAHGEAAWLFVDEIVVR